MIQEWTTYCVICNVCAATRPSDHLSLAFIPIYHRTREDAIQQWLDYGGTSNSNEGERCQKCANR